MSDDGPLAGLRVVDLTRILAGPLCTMILGDMGADVIKVEPPETGDDTRAWGPPFLAGDAVYFLGVNRNKRSLTLNMAVPSGQKILADLIAKADVLIDNFKLGTLEKWGFADAWFERHAPAPRALLDHRVRLERSQGGTSRLRLHPAGGVGSHEHLRRARWQADEIRRGDRRRVHRHARIELDSRRAPCEG